MPTLRRAAWITRLVLVWWTLFIGAAVASPLVKADGLQMVCSGAQGMKLVDLDALDAAGHPAPQGLDCPLCLPVAAPAPTGGQVPQPAGLTCERHAHATARLSSLPNLPWQARAPPQVQV